MAILFHEGLPGSGKSYEATVKQIIPTLLQGRRVFAYIEGINHEKFSEITEIPLSAIRNLLVPITRDQVPEIYKYVEDNSLVVIDEVQNFFPSGRQKMDNEMTQFVTEHRHRGLTIILMGQSIKDCSPLWRRRVEKKFVFMKQTAVGLDKRYKWEAWQATSEERFTKLSSGTNAYEEKYFGLYASHESGVTFTGEHTDDRTIIWKTPFFKYGIPTALIIGFFAIRHIIGFFTTDDTSLQASQDAASRLPKQTQQDTGISGRSSKTAQGNSGSSSTQLSRHSVYGGVNESSDERSNIEVEIDDYVLNLMERTRIRFSGYIASETNYEEGIVEFLDSSFHLKERFTFENLRDLGWEIEQKSFGVIISKTIEDSEYTEIVTSWPIDPFGRTSKRTQQRHELGDVVD